MSSTVSDKEPEPTAGHTL